MIIVAVLLGIVAAIAVAIVVSVRRGKARKQQVIAVGQELGLSPIDNIPSQFGTKLFNQGHYPHFLQPALEGTINGRRLLVFDYTYSSGADDNAITYFLTVVAFAFPERDLPSFGLEKKSFLSRAIAIEGNPDFAKRFCVSGGDQTAIRSLFSPSLVNFLTSTELDKHFTLEGAGNWLVFYSRTIRTAHYLNFLEQTSEIASGFCRHMGSLKSERPLATAAGNAC